MTTTTSSRSTGSDAWWHGPQAPRTLADIAVHHARATPDQRVISRREGSSWVPVTAAQFLAEVDAVAAGLVAAGVQPGDRVALMAKTRYEWTLVDVAVWRAGAVTVPVYETSSPEQLRWILEDSGAVAAVLENRGHLAALEQIRSGLPDLGEVWMIDGPDPSRSLTALAASGAAGAADELERRCAARGPDDLATVIYTSGTTGRPKGVALTHGNFLAETTSAVSALPELFEDPQASTLLFLPLAHVFGRMIQVAVLLTAVHTGHSDIARITKDLPTFSPTFVLAVPRVFERVFDGARRKAVAAGRDKIFDAAAATATAYSKAIDRGRPSPVLRAKHAVFSRLVYAKITAALGGRTQWAVSGGAPLGDRLGHFFRGIGLTVLEGYGLTETTAAATVNTRLHNRIGTVGRPLPGFEVRIADDGEVLLRGGNVFTSYWRNPAATAEVLDADGWFSTGDLGSLDADGYLRITGRKKEILVTSAGKNVSPAPLEDAVRSHPLVSQCIVVGDARPQVAALVTLDPEAVAAWLDQHGRPPTPVADLTTDPALLAELRTAVDRANEGVSGAEEIKKFRVLPIDFTEAGGQMTPSLKLKRSVIMSEFATDVEALYPAR
jgi:long-chain acyl-CoA synthetase